MCTDIYIYIIYIYLTTFFVHTFNIKGQTRHRNIWVPFPLSIFLLKRIDTVRCWNVILGLQSQAFVRRGVWWMQLFQIWSTCEMQVYFGRTWRTTLFCHMHSRDATSWRIPLCGYYCKPCQEWSWNIIGTIDTDGIDTILMMKPLFHDEELQPNYNQHRVHWLLDLRSGEHIGMLAYMWIYDIYVYAKPHAELIRQNYVYIYIYLINILEIYIYIYKHLAWLIYEYTSRPWSLSAHPLTHHQSDISASNPQETRRGNHAELFCWNISSRWFL